MKEENLLNNAKQKFANARTMCPGMSDDAYALTDYISLVVQDNVVPQGLALCMTLIQDDLQKNRNGFRSNEPLPEYLSNNRNKVIAQMVYIPQVVDAIADEKFADEFRKICSEFLGFNTPKRVAVDGDIQYPENIMAAVDWWANAIQSPNLDNGTNIDPFFLMMISGNKKEFSKEEIKAFKDSLASGISKELESYGRCSLSVDYQPCEILSRAGKKIGLGGLDYPVKTKMRISNQVVEVEEGYGASKIIWSKEKDIDDGHVQRKKLLN